MDKQCINEHICLHYSRTVYTVYTVCNYIYTDFHHTQWIHIYAHPPPPRAYQNDAKDEKSLFFQPSPMLIFHLYLKTEKEPPIGT